MPKKSALKSSKTSPSFSRVMDAATGKPLERATWPLKEFTQQDLSIVAALRFPSKAKQKKWIASLKETVELEPDEYWSVFRNYSGRHYRTELDEIERDLTDKERDRGDIASTIQQIKYLVSLAREELQDSQAFRRATIYAINAYKEFTIVIEGNFQLGKKTRTFRRKMGKIRGIDRHAERAPAHAQWKTMARDILQTRPGRSKVALATDIKKRLNLSESIETIRKRI